MGIVAFQWGDKQLMLLQNRDNYDPWMIRAAAWDENNQILRGWLEPNGGTWFGISRNGRVAFLVDAMIFTDLKSCVMLPVEFLQSERSPADFARAVAQDHLFSLGSAYSLIVADINSNSMFCISKMSINGLLVTTEAVGFGVHILSLSGLDSKTSPKALRMKDFFNEMIGEYKNKELPPLKEIAERFMYDPVEAKEGDKLSAFLVDTTIKDSYNDLPVMREERRYRTTSTTALAVKPNKEVMFYERYLENGEWKDHDFTFKIDA